MRTGKVFLDAVFVWMIALVWRSELQHWPSNRVTDSTCCPANPLATYHSPTQWTAAPPVTGLHLPANHSITADSGCGGVGRRHVGGHSQEHGTNVSSGGWARREQRGQRSRGSLEWLTRCERGGESTEPFLNIAVQWLEIRHVCAYVDVVTELMLFKQGHSSCGCTLSN